MRIRRASINKLLINFNSEEPYILYLEAKGTKEELEKLRLIILNEQTILNHKSE